MCGGEQTEWSILQLSEVDLSGVVRLLVVSRDASALIAFYILVHSCQSLGSFNCVHIGA